MPKEEEKIGTKENYDNIIYDFKQFVDSLPMPAEAPKKTEMGEKTE